jgi:hypothetical protein
MDLECAKLVVVKRRERAPYNCTGHCKVNHELVHNGGMLYVGHTFWRKQRRENVAVLANFVRSKRGKRPDRQAEVEAEAAGRSQCTARVRCSARRR